MDLLLPPYGPYPWTPSNVFPCECWTWTSEVYWLDPAHPAGGGSRGWTIASNIGVGCYYIKTASFTLTWFGLYLHHSQVREGASPVSFVGSLCLVCVFVCVCSFVLDVEWRSVVRWGAWVKEHCVLCIGLASDDFCAVFFSSWEAVGASECHRLLEVSSWIIWACVGVWLMLKVSSHFILLLIVLL
jgi:hypothetical protein